MLWDGVIIDLIFVALAVAAVFAGYRKGLVGQVVWFFSSFVAFGLAARFAADLAEVMGYAIVSKPITIGACFLIIFLLATWLFRRVGVWITEMIKKSVAGTVNSTLGAIFNLALYLVVALAIATVASLIIPKANEMIERTYVLKAVMEPARAFMDERILHRSPSDE